MVQEVKRMNSVAYFLKNIRCSLNGHFLCELLIETESMTFSNNSGEAFLRNSELTQSCGFPGQGKTRALRAQKEYQLFFTATFGTLACTLTESWLYASASQVDPSLWRVSLTLILALVFSQGSLGSLFLDLDLVLTTGGMKALLSMSESPTQG